MLEASNGHVIIGIDTGGTFSDFVVLDVTSRRLSTAKVPSTPKEPSRAIEAGLNLLASEQRMAGGWPEDAGRLRVVVGTTVATNAILERQGPTVIYITNEGFTDVPFIGRLDKERLYDLHWNKPPPLVARRNCIGVRGRVGHDGKTIEPLAIEDLAGALRTVMSRAGDEGLPLSQLAVAICTLFSYLDPSHEVAIAACVGDLLPDAPVSVSHEVSPIWREYERASTTIADVFVKPVVDKYISGVGKTVASALGTAQWHLLASNGGQLSAEAAASRPSQVILSGLAGGVVGAQFYAASAQCANFFSLDMGGTSCDIGLVINGEIDHATEFDLAWGVPITVPCVAVRTIGAGGGSIAWVDKGGLLHVGPQSAGADPGPAAYGFGGEQTTVTDANIVLGRLNPDHLLGGRMPLDAAAAKEALCRIGGQLGLDEIEAALAVVRTTDENMANAIRLIAVERGIDPRDYVLVAFGGAGPLHAREVAARLDIRTLLIPPHPGLCGAVGAMIAAPRVDRARTYYARSAHLDITNLARVEQELREQAEGDLAGSGATAIRTRTYAAMRYEGQNYELEVELPEGDVGKGSWEELLRRFALEHEQKFGFSLAGEPVEIVNLRVTAMADAPQLEVESPEGIGGVRERRQVWLSPSAIRECPVYDRASLGVRITGPAIIEEVDSTTVLFPGDVAEVGPMGLLLVEIGKEQ